MITYKSKEEVLKDIDEHLTPWDQKELADEVVSKYVDLNEYVDDNPDEVDLEEVIKDYVQRDCTESVLDMINDDYGIAQYVANDRYMTEYLLDEYHGDASGLIYSLSRSTLTLTEILEAVKDDEDLYNELKKFVVEKCLAEEISLNDFLDKKKDKMDILFKD